MEKLFSKDIAEIPEPSRAGQSHLAASPARPSRRRLAILVGVLAAGMLAVSVFILPTFLAHGWADQVVSRASGSRPSALIAAPFTQAGNQPSSPQESAIRDVIQRADAEQVQAIATGDPSAMADTSTSTHFRELVRINQDLLDHGVTGIALVSLNWGPITVSGTTATATVDETWTTTYADGRTEQSRDRNVYSLVQEGDAWRIQADDHPVTSSPARAALPPRQPQPTDAAVPAGQHTSHNWSGYAATGGTFTAISATWTVPQPPIQGSLGTDAIWVGIGGVRSRDLIQAGTDTAVSGSGQARFRAWIETLPQVARPVPLAVYPGDTVTVSITQQSPAIWLVAFANNTTGQTYQQTVRYASSGSSAEWVVEAPFSSRGLLPLDNFGSVEFRNGSTVKDGQTETIAQAGGQPITMISQQEQALAVPSMLAEDGAGFSVTRTGVAAVGQASGLSQRGRRVAP